MRELNEILNNAEVGICVVNGDGVVSFQNAACSKICADRSGAPCAAKSNLFCRYDRSFNGESVRIPMQLINGHCMDIVGFNLKDHRVTCLIPVQSDKLESARAIEESSLSPKEKDVAALLLSGFSREDIARFLSISENTVKTHIKNIYTKIPSNIIESIRGKAAVKNSGP